MIEPNPRRNRPLELTMAIVTINGWNRLAISFRAEVGGYQSHLSPEPVGSPH